MFLNLPSFDAALKVVSKPGEASLLLTDRCNARIAGGCWDQALKDAGAALNFTIENADICLSIAKAYYHLRRFTECKRQIDRCMKRWPSHQDARELEARCQTRLREQGGKYDFVSMLDEASAKAPNMDAGRASFTGSIEIRVCTPAARGRGYFAMQDIKAGDLVLVEKAFKVVIGSVTASELQREMHPTRQAVPQDKELHRRLVVETFNDLQRNPSLIPKFAKLYPGNVQEMTDERTGLPVFDV